MNGKEIGTIIGNGFTYVLAAIQTNELLQYIEFGLSILVTLVLLVYRIWHWYEEAKKDGKITAEEIKQLGDEIEKSKEDLKK